MATILIVDDNATNRSLLITLLGYKGHRLLEASGGSEALDKLRVENPELIITDILMPKMDGYEFVRKVRSLPGTHQPKIIFNSATYLEKEALALAHACGVSRVICKPVEPEYVLKIVDEALANGAPETAPAPGDDGVESEAVRVLSNKLYQKVQELEELNGELERRVAERTAELERTNRSLQEQIIERQKAETEAARSIEERLRMKSEFLSHVSHELRSPLGVVHQFTTILLDGLAGPLSSDQREYLQITLRNIDQLKFMIDDLLEASRADVGKLALKRSSTRVDEIINQTVEAQRSIATEKGLCIESQISRDLPVVYADPTRVSQVLTNLLDNAIKFSPPKTTITLHAGTFENDPNFVCISVTDCGCGIKPENADRIFDRLYQETRPIESSRQGLGLGLYICKQLVSLHGGSIWVDVKKAAGSTFHFTLPIFTLRSMIAPLFAGEGHLAASMTLITVEVLPKEPWRNEVHRERSLHRIHQLLERCVLPDLDVLLPAENWAGLDVFGVVARTDERGAKVMLSRIREQLSRFEDIRRGGIFSSVKSEVFDLAPLVQGLTGESAAAPVADYLQGLFSKLKDRSKSP